MTTKSLIIISIAISLTGCLPDPLPVSDIPTLQSKVVISSQMTPYSGLVVSVSKSLGALDVGDDTDIEDLLSQILIDNAIVTIKYNNQTDTLSNLGDGLYLSVATVWEEGVSYTLHVDAGEYGEVEATSQVTHAVTFDFASVNVSGTDDNRQADVSYGFKDPAADNYYAVNVQRYSGRREYDFLNERIYTHLLQDAAFNGGQYSEDFVVPFSRYHHGDTVAVFLSSIDQTYYNFLKLRNDSEFSLGDFISEPINYPSNVNGGYGFFNLYLPDVKVFVIE